MSTAVNQILDGPSSQPTNLFLTGCYRSGTTLLEKLLHMRPRVCLASQPFPALYFHLKNTFYQRRGLSRRYPLDHLFLERDYRRSDFRDFLDEHCLRGSDLREVFEQLEGYPGWGTPQLRARRDEIRPGRFMDVYTQLNGILAQLFPKTEGEAPQYAGGKEVLGEEFIPYLISHGAKVLVIIRDPREVITSLNFRKRTSHTGSTRPILYSLRVWRKSVAFALACEGDPNLLWLRYEDLVREPDRALNRLTDRLQLPRPDWKAFIGGIRDQSGQPWGGNSSFDEWKGVSSQGVGRFRSMLSESVLEYIESCCMPEMKALDYPLAGSGVFSEKALRDFREPIPVDHAKFAPGYSQSPEHLEQELERYRRLQSAGESDDTRELESWFIHSVAYSKLRRVCS